MIRFLTEVEVTWLDSFVETKLSMLHPDNIYRAELSTYFNQAMKENETGELITHADEPWQDSLSMRYGAQSVLGTAYELAVMVDLHSSKKAQWVRMEHDAGAQVGGIDLIMSPTMKSHQLLGISVKKLCERSDGYIRFGQDYFPHVRGKHVGRADILAFYDVKRDVCHYQSYDACRDVFRAYDKIEVDGDRYIYRDKNWLLIPTAFDWTLAEYN